MVAPLNPNISEVSFDNTLLPPRNSGRGFAPKLSGSVSEVTWSAGQIQIDGVNFFSLASNPVLLDFAFDLLDRGQVVWKEAGGNVFIRFYDPILVGYNSLNIGNVDYPAICNDFILDGNNTVLVYLVSGIVKYRLQSDRYQTEYTLSTTPISIIRRFGVQPFKNSLAVLKTLP